MKKLSLILAMALAAVVNYSCGEYDNTANTDKTVFVDENGVEHETGLLATFYAAPGAEVTLGISVVDETDFYAVQSATTDAKEVTSQKRTDLKVTVADNGIVKVYGKSKIKQLYVANALPSAFDQAVLSDVEWIQIKGVEIDGLKIPALSKLTYLYLNTCKGINLLDVTEATNLETLLVQYTENSKLTNIDLTNNTKLKLLRIQGKNDNKGALKAIDLTRNTNLTEINLSFNQLQSILLADSYPALKTLSLRGNQLTELILNGSFPALTSLTANENQLTSIKVPSTITTMNVATNKLTMADIPLNATTYGNQAPMEVTVKDNILDLSSQLYIDGVKTVYTIDGLVEGVDYLVYDGQFKFLKKLSNVVVKMTNARLPKFTTAYPFMTVPFNTGEPSNEVFAWYWNGTSAYINGGQIFSIPNDDDMPSHKIGYGEHTYATILIDGTMESVAKEKFNYIRVDLDEPLKKGMKVSFTGFRHVLGELNANLYLVFNLTDEDPINYVPNVFNADYTGYTTFAWDIKDCVFNNLKSSSLTPNTYEFIVDESMAGSKSFKIARGTFAETPIYLTKIAISRN